MSNGIGLVVVEVRTSFVKLCDVFALAILVVVILSDDCIVCDLALAKSLNDLAVAKSSLFVEDAVLVPLD